jgi:hypothetical protein
MLDLDRRRADRRQRESNPGGDLGRRCGKRLRSQRRGDPGSAGAGLASEVGYEPREGVSQRGRDDDRRRPAPPEGRPNVLPAPVDEPFDSPTRDRESLGELAV